MKIALATAVAAVVFAGSALVPADARASTPVPWCGTDSVAADRLPDDTTGYSVHVIYAFPSDRPDRFAELAPKIAGDAAAIDAWWRQRDPTRVPRFDLHAFPNCGPTFGRLDVSRVQLPEPNAAYSNPSRFFGAVATTLVQGSGFDDVDKRYLIYFDGAVDYPPDGTYCGIAGGGSEGGAESFAFVMLRACGLDANDSFRALVAAHELIHSMGATPAGAPNACRPDDPGHVCDHVNDVLAPGRVGRGFTLADRLLDANRDDYYGHGATGRLDVRESQFLERLDGPDRAVPTTPSPLVRGAARGGAVLTWSASTDDVGPVRYWVYENAELVERGIETRSYTFPDARVGEIFEYAVRAEDNVGHLTQRATVRFKVGFGIVDAAGAIVRDTVPPSAIGRVTVRKTAKTVTLRWQPAVERVGLSNYRVTTSRGTVVVRRPTVTIPRTRLGTRGIAISAVDRAGNTGASVLVSRSRLR